MRAVFSSMNAAVIASDLSGKVTYRNHLGEQLFDSSANGLIERNLSEILRDDRNGPSQFVEVLSCVQGGRAWTGPLNLRMRNGKLTSGAATFSSLMSSDGETVGMVGVIYDRSPTSPTENGVRETASPLRESREDLENRVRERTLELNAANDNLRELSGRLLSMQDDERRRIARELHDSVGQMLAAVSINSASVEAEASKLSPAAVRAISENSGLIAEINKEIRTISHLLHPPLLDEAGLTSALSWYIRGFSERSKINVAIDIAPDFVRPSEEIEIAIFRIVQESLTNIHRHSESAEASVQVVRAGDRVLVEIKDEGKGIPQKSALTLVGRAGVGIRGMRERVGQLGGVLKIDSDSNGTTVKADLPVNANDRAHPNDSASSLE